MIEEHNKRWDFFRDITGEAMRVHRKFHFGLLESAYEAALKYLLEQKDYTVERQVYLPIYWDEVKLDQTYRIDLMVNGNIIIELKAVKELDDSHRSQIYNYLKATGFKLGFLINFGKYDELQIERKVL